MSRIRTWNRRLAAMAAALALTAAGCGSSAESPSGEQAVEAVDRDRSTGAATIEVEPTAAFLAQAARASEAADRFRAEAHMTLRMVMGPGERLTINPDRPVMTSEHAGGAFTGRFDLGAMFDSMMGQAPPDMRQSYFEAQQTYGDFVMEMAGDASVTYLRAPFFQWFADQGGLAADDPMAPLFGLGDRWGRVDLAALGADFAASDLGSLLGGSNVGDPAEVRALLMEVGSDVEDLGVEVIDTVPVHGLSGVVGLGAMLEAQGMDPATVAEMAGPEGAAFMDDLLAMQVPIEAWVDADGLVRRLEVSMDFGDLIRGLPTDAGEPVPADFAMEMGMQIDFSDYGDPSVAPALPDPTSAVDLTPWVRSLLDSGALAP